MNRGARNYGKSMRSNILVRDVMDPCSKSISTSSTLSEAAAAINERNAPVLPVTEDSLVRGYVTAFLLMERGLLREKDPEQTVVSEVMERRGLFVFKDQDVRVATRIMKAGKTGGLVVLNKQCHPVGILHLQAAYRQAPEAVRAVLPEYGTRRPIR